MTNTTKTLRSAAISLLPAVALALPIALTPAAAKACGGTFCDGGPNPMPVEQTGEDILFIRDGNEMEVHVRIQYTGAAERFAWMVPVAAVPQVSLGSEEMFRVMSATTIPLWDTNRTFLDPDDRPSNNGSGNLSFVPADDPDEPEEPSVVYEEVVGQFEVVVLQGGAASEVIEFFIANDYAFEDNAEPLIQEYIDEGFLITGVKLTAGADVEAIQPLVFRFVASEPCVPIRLTAVAAKDDMGIRAYFLGDERWGPANYKHVVLNPMAFDWSNLDFTTYIELVSTAVDEAGGQAFVTEYAGPSERIETSTFTQPDWTSEGMESMEEHQLLETLDDFGMLPPSPDVPSPQLVAVMREFLPPPENWLLSEIQFWYAYLYNPDLLVGGGIDSGFEALGELTWDLAGFAAAFEERVIMPGAHAGELLERWPMLTRLHTTMSAHEMTLDPTFHPAPELPEVFEQRVTEALVLPGLAWTTYTVPLTISPSQGAGESSAQLCVEDDGNWPFDSPTIADMPRALRIEAVPASGPTQLLVDNEAEILEAVQWHNLETPCSTGEPMGGDESGSGSGGSGESGAGAADSGAASCACNSGRGGGGPLGLGLLGLLGLLGFTRRRS
ncbi:hypothetical protein DB30_00287 [Enhygromyxa salina]|uniref:DUF2330 domain-containing protein n=1 Tax=Enhygromyxa salina TaxID=215803 RepID=A0A0C2DFZ5_9BACT|nr:DUF2330 domain-containing protein [Enhygromyxa salina]KIG18602.1 hypothetical protein DB30_00287 [Enhygromyxa salina]